MTGERRGPEEWRQPKTGPAASGEGHSAVLPKVPWALPLANSVPLTRYFPFLSLFPVCTLEGPRLLIQTKALGATA